MVKQCWCNKNNGTVHHTYFICTNSFRGIPLFRRPSSTDILVTCDTDDLLSSTAWTLKKVVFTQNSSWKCNLVQLKQTVRQCYCYITHKPMLLQRVKKLISMVGGDVATDLTMEDTGGKCTLAQNPVSPNRQRGTALAWTSFFDLPGQILITKEGYWPMVNQVFRMWGRQNKINNMGSEQYRSKQPNRKISHSVHFPNWQLGLDCSLRVTTPFRK